MLTYWFDHSLTTSDVAVVALTCVGAVLLVVWVLMDSLHPRE
jgi:energy-coupling factor transporter transmembrane protein EcfT